MSFNKKKSPDKSPGFLANSKESLRKPWFSKWNPQAEFTSVEKKWLSP